MQIQLGEYPAPSHTIAHLSDPHLLADGALQYDAIDTDAGLLQALARLGRIDPAPRAIVFTGDLADLAEPAAYARLRELVEPAAEAMGAQVVWTMGNHDERAPYAAGLFGEASEEPQDRVYDIDGLRVIALDTSVPGYHHGEIDAAQRAWLADVLATPAEHGTVLAMHHPPIPLPMLRAAEVIELADQDLLAEVITGTDVRSIIGGHFHFSTYASFAGVPVSVASASCYTTDPAPDRRFVSGVDGHGAFTMMHFYADRVVHTVVPLADAPEVTGVSLEMVSLLESLSFEERRENVSRKDSDFNRGTQALPGD